MQIRRVNIHFVGRYEKSYSINIRVQLNLKRFLKIKVSRLFSVKLPNDYAFNTYSHCKMSLLIFYTYGRKIFFNFVVFYYFISGLEVLSEF